MKVLLFFAAVCLVICAGLQFDFAKSCPGPGVRDLGDEVRSLFMIKCAGCHNAASKTPPGRFGYVVDLQRVAANPELVIPLRPTESELWVLVEQNEMPPADSPDGALTDDQKELIRAWIAAGAPPPSAKKNGRRVGN